LTDGRPLSRIEAVSEQEIDAYLAKLEEPKLYSSQDEATEAAHLGLIFLAP
jgi:hypothetical protein